LPEVAGLAGVAVLAVVDFEAIAFVVLLEGCLVLWWVCEAEKCT